MDDDSRVPSSECTESTQWLFVKEDLIVPSSKSTKSRHFVCGLDSSSAIMTCSECCQLPILPSLGSCSVSSWASIDVGVCTFKTGPHCVVLLFRPKKGGVELKEEFVVDILLDSVPTSR